MFALTLNSAAISTSCAKPRSINSFPEQHVRNDSLRLRRQCSNAAAASVDSGEQLPDNALITAPAPSKSSTLGRTVPSFHISPAGITAKVLPKFIAARATASAFLRHAVRTTGCSTEKANAAPLGGGSTNRYPAGKSRNEVGDSEKPLPRLLARVALTELAYSTAEAPLSGYSKITPPCPTPTSTAVEKEEHPQSQPRPRSARAP